MTKYLIIIPLIISVCLNYHNFTTYNPDFGFDGKDHQSYIRIINSTGKIPLPHQGWELSQPPLYYLLGSLFMSFHLPVQLLNFLIFYLIALILYKFTKSFLLLFAYISLPMANLFPPLVTNELLGSFFIILGLLLMLYQPSMRSITFTLILGFYAKYTIMTLLPLVPIAYYLSDKNIKKTLRKTLVTYGLFLLSISPILIRDYTNYHTLLPLAVNFNIFSSPGINKDFRYFLNLDWIKKVDTFQAKQYSFLGGIWNTFWLDGYQVITPIVAFHKKALLLWVLGFPLIALSLIGLFVLSITDRNKALLIYSYIIIGYISLIKYNLDLPYDFVLKAFYAFGLIVPYLMGIYTISQVRNLKKVILLLLSGQFMVMVSYFWVSPLLTR